MVKLRRGECVKAEPVRCVCVCVCARARIHAHRRPAECTMRTHKGK